MFANVLLVALVLVVVAAIAVELHLDSMHKRDEGGDE